MSATRAEIGRRSSRFGGQGAVRWAVGLALMAMTAGWASGAIVPGLEPPELAEAAPPALGIPQVVLLVAFAAGILYVLNWAVVDVRFAGADQTLWGSVLLGAALAGFAAAMLVPFFYIGLPLGLVVFGGAAVAYVVHRNARVAPELAVLSKAHLERVRKGLKGGPDGEGGPASGVGRDVIFMGMDDLPLPVPSDTTLDTAAVRQVDELILEAVSRDATLIGILAKGRKAQARLRVHGQVSEPRDLPPPGSERVAAVLKRLAGLNPEETRKPQEGRLRAVVSGLTFELRVKTSGSVRGEQIAIRIIDLASAQMRLEDLNLAEGQLEQLRDALARKPGMVIVSGPRDSGLTTTLHACLRAYDRLMNTCVEFEPRVEVEVENVQHVALNQEDGEAAAEEIRRRIRMEPDVLAIDSLSSPEVASVLAEVAQERRVLIGLRAADAGQALGLAARLIGSAEPLAGSLHLVANQRLVRKLCPACREAYRPNPEFLRKANLTHQRVDVLYRAKTRVEMEKGVPVVCSRCRNVRYAGRTGLFEVMPIDEEARRLIRQGASVSDIRSHARKQGMRNLQEEGLRLVIDGTTSVEEVLRAIKQVK